MAEIFSELMKSIKPEIHNQSTKGKEKVLKEPEKQTNYLEQSDLYTSQHQQQNPEDSGMIDICNEITDNLEFYAQRKWQHTDIFI